MRESGDTSVKSMPRSAVPGITTGPGMTDGALGKQAARMFRSSREEPFFAEVKRTEGSHEAKKWVGAA